MAGGTVLARHGPAREVRTTTTEVRSSVERLLDSSEKHLSCAAPEERGAARIMAGMARDGLLVSPLRGLYVRASFWKGLNPREQHLALMRGLAVRHPDWVFCGPSAAVAHGLAVSFPLLRTVHVAYARGGRHDTAGVTWHYVNSDETTRALGLCVTSFERTVCDCLRSMATGDALAVADSALRVTGYDRQWLVDLVWDHCEHRRGVAQAMLVASLADGRAENGGESVARATMYELGFQMPDLQVSFPDVLTGEPYRVDFLWRLGDDTLVAGELDGKDKYQDSAMLAGRSTVEAFSDERLRESRLTRDVKVVRFSYAVAKSPKRLRVLLDSYGIPHDDAPRPHDLLAPPKRRSDHGGHHAKPKG